MFVRIYDKVFQKCTNLFLYMRLIFMSLSNPKAFLIAYALFFSCSNQAPPNECGTIPYQNTQSLEFKYGFQVYHDLDLARECASATKRPIFLMFNSYSTHSAPKDEWKILADKEVKDLIESNFVFVILYKDDQEKLRDIDTTIKTQFGNVVETHGQFNSELQARMFQSNSMCYYICLNSTLEQISNPFYCLRNEDKKELIIQLRNAINHEPV